MFTFSHTRSSPVKVMGKSDRCRFVNPSTTVFHYENGSIAINGCLRIEINLTYRHPAAATVGTVSEF